MTFTERDEFSAANDIDHDMSIEPDDDVDSEETLQLERERYAPIIAALEELEAALTRAEDETAREHRIEEHAVSDVREEQENDCYLL